MKYLKFSGVSVDKPGTYRWFQSKHELVNRVVEQFQELASITLSKTSIREISDMLEKELELEKTEWEKEE